MEDIKILQHNISKELEEELAVYEADDFHRKLELESVNNINDLTTLLNQTKHFQEIKNIFSKQTMNENAGKSVIDIGVGVGLSSLLIALLGYTVTAVEPSLTCCKILQNTVKKLNLPIRIINSTAEGLSQLNETFDIGVYHSSLHHCDDPVLALQTTHARLKKHGKLFLIEEPLLRCYRTKKWFYRMLKEQPEKMGHYGGNEHIYRLQEYTRFLRKAGFSKIKLNPSIIYANKPEKWIGDNSLRYFIKQHYYKIMNVILNQQNIIMRLISTLLIQLSLIYVTFEADAT
jgi:2-polyprenyl-3-methyl-5-hydroxy-6-metoxy-1,4-benzoquinol methylase